MSTTCCALASHDGRPAAPPPHGPASTAASRVRQPPTKRSLVSRRRTVLWTKRVLPVVAVLLLASVAMWPEISRQFDNARFASTGRAVGRVQAGKLLNVRYHGLDARNRPYTITADEAVQARAGTDQPGRAQRATS